MSSITWTELSSIANPTIKHLLVNAFRSMQFGEYRRCVELVCAALEQLLALRMESVVRAVRQQMPALATGIRVVHSDVGFRAELTKAEYNEDECEIYLRYAFLLHKALAGHSISETDQPELMRFTFRERLLIFLQTLSNQCLLSHHSLTFRKAPICVLQRLRFYLELILPTERATIDMKTQILSILLHEPEPVAQEIFRQFRFHREYNFAKRLLHLRGFSDSRPCPESFIWLEKEAYLDYIAAQPGSRVLVTIHMGDFLGAFRCFSELASPGRFAISLRREQLTDQEKDYEIGSNLNHKILRHDQYNPVNIVSGLRKGNHTLAILFDLRDEFGESETAIFFGHRARFVKGPAQLAIMGKAPILPFITFERNGRSYLEMERIIETHLLADESLYGATSRITQQLVSLAEKWITRTPEQWRYLSTVSAYFERPSPPEGASPVRDPGKEFINDQ